MSDEIQIEGKSYISSKRASELSGYAQDYIGQLSRKSLIDSRRIGGLWYVSMESLEAYKKKAEEFKPEPPARAETAEPGTLIFFDGKEYLSAARAAEITGYTQDYVGQLARGGTIFSHQVGNRWYVERQSILSHKKEKDRLLAAVQTEAVGLLKPKSIEVNGTKYQENVRYSGSAPLLNYFSEEADLVPVIETTIERVSTHDVKEDGQFSSMREPVSSQIVQRPVPIRRVRYTPRVATRSVADSGLIASPIEQKRSLAPLLLGAAATIIIVVSVGYASILKQNAVYATNIRSVPNLNALPASVDVAFDQIGNLLEPFLTHELTYERSGSQ